MKKNKLFNYYIITILSIILSISTKAQTNTKYNSVFWEISNNNLKQPSYLFGTIHLIPKNDFKFTKQMYDRFNKCKLLVLEANIDIPLTTQLKMAKKMLLPDGKTISDYMSDTQYSKYKSYMIDSLKISSFMFQAIQHVKPIFSSALILNELLENPTAYEQEFMKVAKTNNMKIKGLETLDFQMNLMDSINISEQIKMLVENNSKNPLYEYNKILEAYKQQDLKKLYSFFKEDESFSSMEASLLANRNIKWILSIKKIIANQSAFIAVGAGHLYGKSGLLMLLEKEGYTIKPIK